MAIKYAKLKPEVELRPHQQQAIDFINKNRGRGLLAHGTGSGKTLSGIAAVEDMRSNDFVTKALVVTPASLKDNFIREGIQKFTDNSVFDGVDGESDYQVMSIDKFRKNPLKFLEESGANTLVIDEIQRAKDRNSLTSKSLRQASNRVENIIGLTGSFISNHPKEVLPLLNIIDASHTLGNPTQFTRRYTDREKIRGGGSFLKETRYKTNLKNRAPLGRQLIDRLSYLSHGDLKKDMPKMTVEDVHVPMSAEQDKLYNFALGNLTARERRLIASGLPPTQTEASHILPIIMKARQAANSIGSHKDMPMGEAAEGTPKLKQVMDDVEKHLKKTPDGQAIVFTNLVKGGADALHAGLTERGHDVGLYAGIGALDGMVTSQGRQDDIDAFKKGDKNIILLTPAAAEGVSLNNATAFFEVDRHYNPEKNQQAVARGRRLGGLAHRPVKDRVLEVKRYFSDPKPRIFASKRFGIDEWIGNIANEKDRLNEQLRSTVLKQRNIANKNAAFEDIFVVNSIKVAMRITKLTRNW